MQLLHFLILALAVWRLSSLLVSEDGPGSLLANFREQARRVTDLFECVWCVSVWGGFIITILWVFYPTETMLACLPLALSALAIGWDRWING